MFSMSQAALDITDYNFCNYTMVVALRIYTVGLFIVKYLYIKVRVIDTDTLSVTKPNFLENSNVFSSRIVVFTHSCEISIRKKMFLILQPTMDTS